MELRPGVRVVGRVSSNVPRPITRGYVCVHAGPPAARGGDVDRQADVRRNFWLDWAPIAEDGTFEFPSLPSGFLAQFSAFANDSISAQPTDAAFEICCKWFGENIQRNNFFRYGQVLRLVGAKSELTIQMEPAGMVRVKCTSPDGRPISGIKVDSWPNQDTIGAAEEWIFCTKNSTIDRLRRGKQTEWTMDAPYTAETDQAGEAVIHNLARSTILRLPRSKRNLWRAKTS